MKIFVDITLMSIVDDELAVLCIKRKREGEPFYDEWALPGGYVPEHSATLEEAAESTLRREIGLQSNFYLEQLYTFGPSGDPRWKRISISYLALVHSKEIKTMETNDAKEVKWLKLSELPQLAFDHNQIVKKAKERIQNKIQYTPIGFYFVGNKFTMNELIQTFSCILDKKIDQSNLRKKLLSLGVITETREKVQQKKGRPSPVFKLNRKVLDSLPNTECFFGRNS